MICLVLAEFVTILSEKYGERMVAYGLADQIVMQVYADPDDGSWSVLMLNPEGVACIVAAGDNFAAIKAGPNL